MEKNEPPRRLLARFSFNIWLHIYIIIQTIIYIYIIIYVYIYIEQKNNYIIYIILSHIYMYIYNQAIIDAANLDGCGKWKNLGPWISPATAFFFLQGFIA